MLERGRVDFRLQLQWKASKRALTLTIRAHRNDQFVIRNIESFPIPRELDRRPAFCDGD